MNITLSFDDTNTTDQRLLLELLFLRLPEIDRGELIRSLAARVGAEVSFGTEAAASVVAAAVVTGIPKPPRTPVVPGVPATPAAPQAVPTPPPVPATSVPTQHPSVPTPPAVPPPPSTPPAPPVAPQQTAEGQSSPPVETDSLGHPWHEEVHSSSKKKTQKGVWRRKKGVTDEQLNAFFASHIQIPAGDALPDDAGDIPPPPPVPPPPVSPGIAMPPPPPPTALNDSSGFLSAESASWDDVMAVMMARRSTHTRAQIHAALEAVDISPTQLVHHPELYAKAVAAVESGCPLPA